MLDSSRLVSILAGLVKIDSVNPDLVAGGRGERQIAEHVAAFLEAAGLETRLQEVSPGRFNALGVLRGRAKGKSLMLNGHLDTVGVAGMEGPFSARVEDGRLYGRGAEDMKSGIAAALVAVEALAREGLSGGEVLVATVADEEYKSIGTRALLDGGARTDAAIVMEPTKLAVVTAHKGFVWADVVTEGRAAHGSRPDEGRDAIAAMGRVLGEIEALQRALDAAPGHPLVGHGSVHASLISGGQELSSYPAECRLSLERRLVPGEDAAALDQELSRILARLSGRDPEFRARYQLGYSARPFEVSREAPLARKLLGCARHVMGPHARFGVQSFWTDAALLAEAGIETVLFGPSGQGLHSTSEYADVESVALCAETLCECAKEFCSS
ncbi:MAG TPA: ArgE/DapE family deacylase [Terriglobia bacterium]|nr:ArgE/DapE family deacylase [Terriglobia bacterium]